MDYTPQTSHFELLFQTQCVSEKERFITDPALPSPSLYPSLSLLFFLSPFLSPSLPLLNNLFSIFYKRPPVLRPRFCDGKTVLAFAVASKPSQSNNPLRFKENYHLSIYRYYSSHCDTSSRCKVIHKKTN